MKSILKISLLSTLIGTSSVVMANDVIPLQKGDIALSELKHSTSEFQKDSGSLAKVQNATAIIDVVIFYQPSFMEFWGDQVGYARIHEWVEEANQTLANSDIDAAYRVKKISPTISIPDIPYDDVLDEDGNVIEDGAGYLFSVNVLNDFPSNPERDIYVKFDGDLVVYVRSYEGETTGGSSVRGYGSIQGQSSTVFDWQVHDSNAIDAGGHTLAHEFGHNLGAGHERENNNFFTGETYAAAYRCGGINTAVWSGFNGTAHKFYSSPNKIVDGEKCGVEIGEVDEADNASAIRSFAPIAAVRAQATPSLGTVSIDEQVILVDEVTGKVEVSLTRSGDITESASVEVAAFNETAIQGEDFVEGYIEAVFQAGQATTSVEFTISQDSEIENNERFTLALRYPYKLTASTKESVVVITSNGSDVTGDFSFGDVRASEQAKEACVTINRENGTNGEVIFLANTENGTASNDDYIALDSELVVFEDGVSSQAICFAISDDASDEGDETINFLLSTPINVTYQSSVVVNIKDNDAADYSVGDIKFETLAATFDESAGAVTINVLRENGSDGDIKINVALEHISSTSGDVTLETTELVFLDGETIGEIKLNLINDTIVEPSETFNIVLTANTPSELVVDASPMVITLNSEDVAPKKDTGGDSSGGGGSFGYLLVMLGLLVFKRATK